MGNHRTLRETKNWKVKIIVKIVSYLFLMPIIDTIISI